MFQFFTVKTIAIAILWIFAAAQKHTKTRQETANPKSTSLMDTPSIPRGRLGKLPSTNWSNLNHECQTCPITCCSIPNIKSWKVLGCIWDVHIFKAKLLQAEYPFLIFDHRGLASLFPLPDIPGAGKLATSSAESGLARSLCWHQLSAGPESWGSGKTIRTSLKTRHEQDIQIFFTPPWDLILREGNHLARFHLKCPPRVETLLWQIVSFQSPWSLLHSFASGSSRIALCRNNKNRACASRVSLAIAGA